jgi:serine/threonine-protein kinase
LLGKGNYGAVYYALDSNLNSPVAVKEILTTSAQVAQEFALEARMLANLRHVNLPYVIDHFSLQGSSGGTSSAYLVMEFIEGENLQNIIDRTGRGIPEAQALPWFKQIYEALSFLHSQSPAIIHRDIKPANIRITSEGKAMLVDFGVTRVSDSTRRTTILTEGSEIAFIPPELQAGVADECSDIYALGATLYASLTGIAPPDALKRQTRQVVPSLRRVNPTINPKTEGAILRAMELAPERRYQSVDEFATALGLLDLEKTVPPTQVVQDYAQQQYPAGAIPPTVLVKPAPAIGHDRVPPPREKGSRGWIMWVLVILGIVCLFGGIVSGVGLYTIFYSTGTPTPTATIQKPSTEDQAATQTAVFLQSISPIPPTTASAPDTSTPTPFPSWTSVLTLPPSLTFTPTLVPSLTPSPSPTEIPEANPTWQPCPGALASRLHVGNRAYVSHDPPLANRVRAQPKTGSTIVGLLQPGEKMEIVGGPACSDQWVWWQIRSLVSSLTGWTAEGDTTTYWLVPLP